MYACYRREDAASAETMLDAAAVVLAQYPDEVMERVTHPVTGIPGRLKWPPSIYELREACEAELAPVEAAKSRADQAERQLAEREQYEKTRAEIARMSIDELKAKYGDRWGLAAEKEDKEAKQKRENLRHMANRRYHGEVSDNYVSPALMAWEKERSSMSVVPEARGYDMETTKLGQQAAAIVRAKMEVMGAE